jgi:hypothetical protein
MVKFPKLETFSHHRQGHPSGNLGAFLEEHQGIRTLELSYSLHSGTTMVMERLSQFTKRVSTLILHIKGWRVDWAESLVQPNVFPALSTLGIIRRRGMVSIEEFERIVKARCLPLSHFMSRAIEASSIFDVFYIDILGNHLGNADWFGSELYTEATKKIVDFPDQSKRVYLAWSPEQHRALPA